MAEASGPGGAKEEAGHTFADDRTILIVTGVSGSGKTTIARALAQQLGWPFKEGDDLHPASDISKMHSGHPLDDRDRWPWLENVADWIDSWRRAGTSGVITCSALKRSYRDFLTSGRPEVRVVYLYADKAVIAARLAVRTRHFMPTSLLDSQFAILEEPDPDEDPIRVDVSRLVGDIVGEILGALNPPTSENRSPVVPQIKADLKPTDQSIGPRPSGARQTSIRSDLPLAIEDYALIGDCITAALVGRNGSIDWLCWPRFDGNACFAALLGTSEHGRWQICPADPAPRISRAYRDGSMVLETVFDTADGRVAVIDFMPIGRANSSVIRLVQGQRGKVAMRLHMALRFDYGTTVPWVTQLEDGSGLSAIAGPSRVVLRSPVALRGRNFATVAEFDVAEGEWVPFVHDTRHLPPAAARSDRLAGGVAGHEIILARMVCPLLLHRSQAGGGPALVIDLEGADLRGDRRDCRRSHYVAARAARRRTQLGLPLLLAARCHLDTDGAGIRWLSRRSAGVARVAAAQRGGKSQPAPDHVWLVG